MRIRFSLALAAAFAAGLTGLQAQNDFGYRAIDTGSAIGLLAQDDKIPTWLAISADGLSMTASCVRTNKISTVTAKAQLNVLRIDRIPLIVQEDKTGNYWGLNLYGDLVPLQLPAAATVTEFSQDLFGLIYGNDAYVFGNWSTSWRKVALTSANPLIQAGRSCMIVRDGQNLYGFSSLFPDQPAHFVVTAAPQGSPIPGSGEIESRRNFQAYDIGTGQVAAYSPYTNKWSLFALGAPISAVTFEYDKNVMMVADPVNNRLWCYSSLSGAAVPRPVANLANVTTNVQDFCIRIDDQGGDLILFRGIDTAYTVLPGRQKDVLPGGGLANNHWTFVLNDPVKNQPDLYGISGTYRGAQVVPAGMTAGESILFDADNDCVTVAVTDKALYGFSALTNNWAVFRGYKGAYKSAAAQDFIGRVTTDTHTYAYNPREDKWHELAMSSSAKSQDTDQAVIVTEGATSKSVLSMQSLAWRTQVFTGALFQEGRENSYCYSIHDANGGGSTVWFFQNFGDRWFKIDLKNRVTDPKNVIELEDGLLIVDGTTVHAFSGFGDLSTNWSAPNDNAAFHAIPGAFARFTAAGPANTPAILLFGLDRQDLPIPGFAGELQVALNGILPFYAGVYGADGTLRFNVTLVGAPAYRFRFQMLGVDLVQGPSFGRVLDFQVF